ncbi:uncharacterized protein BDZ99DRAFT_267857 [Mytilinidion resinicola]|uniref:Uncharacterized protein n=1 Tax=Mytilinidion resinicola TaxID=574789 RepID=A0A6A6YVU0_9PEZI|nr:uncharacterized protein BDZ99DRAFT_267857 [Mytilinidion resinicola]KAF2812493.1 hypothetical protein BDZ99DRAFT_267857 [Mytilinidion resinicola]
MDTGEANQEFAGKAAGFPESSSTGSNGKQRHDDSDQTRRDECHKQVMDAMKRLGMKQAPLYIQSLLYRLDRGDRGDIRKKALEEANAPVEENSWDKESATAQEPCLIAQPTCPIVRMINRNLSIAPLKLTGNGRCGVLTENVMKSMPQGGLWLPSTWDCVLATIPVPENMQVLRINGKDFRGMKDERTEEPKL